MKHRPFAPIATALALAVAGSAAGTAGAASFDYDRVAPLSGIERFDGSPLAPAATLSNWKQMLFEIRRAEEAGASGAMPAAPVPDLDTIMAGASRREQDGVVPLAVMDFLYRRTPPGKTPGAVPEETRRVFAAAALGDHTYRGGDVRFVLDPARWFTNVGGTGIPSIEINFGDGGGWRAARLGEPIAAHYGSTGAATIELRALTDDGGHLHASFPFKVQALSTPSPNDTLAVTARVPWQGQYGTGQAYVYLAASHTALTMPIVVIEGFDLDNSMNWPELYALLNQQNLLETLRAQGFDAVVLNFTDATLPIQENGFVVESLLETVEGLVGPAQPIVLAGASMGGLCSRWALAWMETNGVPHHVNTWISFDGPQKGADIPLGIQYWLDFFSGLSSDAAYLLGRLDTPAARQMLLYHHTSPPGSTGAPDPTRISMLADFAAIGNYPAQPRKVAIANGSGYRENQGFNPRDQLIYYHYNSFLVDIVGDIWAVPAGGPTTQIFNGLIDFILLPPTTESVNVSATATWDNAPGGSRPTMAQMDSTSTGYGDIVALHPSHCFIPTVSSLALDTSDPFYDIAGDPNLLAHTPFNAVYYPVANEEHVTITPETAGWIIQEVDAARTDVASNGPGAPAGAPHEAAVALLPNQPNPFRGATTVEYELAHPADVSLEVFDTAGRRVAALAEGRQAAGRHQAVFDAGGAPSGLYFCRLRADGREDTIKMALAR